MTFRVTSVSPVPDLQVIAHGDPMSSVRFQYEDIRQSPSIRRDANVHYVANLIFVYEQAVKLHNAGHPRHRAYQARYEEQLRHFVQISTAVADSRERATEAVLRSQHLERQCQQLDRRVSRVLKRL